MALMTPANAFVLTDEQRAAVEWADGPLMVLAGAGTGKTTVIVERVAHLLARDATLQPEQILVLTYYVKAAAELRERFERRLGVDEAARLWVQNFHSFGHRVMQENRAELGLPPAVDVLDPIGQRLLLREIRPGLELLYYGGRDRNQHLGHWADLISRAKDELVSPEAYAAHAESQRAAFEGRFWGDTIEGCRESLRGGTFGPVRKMLPELRDGRAEQGAKREARRVVRDDGYAWFDMTEPQRERYESLWPTFIRDAEALEVVRVQEEARVYAAYQAALHERGALDFGEQILQLITLFRDYPNVLRRYQDQFRHILVDEFQDANVAQIVLLELLGRAPGRVDDVIVVGDDDQSIYRFRGASYAAFQQFRERFGAPPPWDPERAPRPVAELPLLRNRRSTARILSAAGRLIRHNEARLKEGLELAPDREPGTPVDVIFAQDEADEADAIVDWIRTVRPGRWSDVAVLYRKHRHRELIVDRLRRANIPYQAIGGVGLFAHPEVRDLEAALRTAADPYDSMSFTRVLSAPPWRFDAAQIVRLTRAAAFDESPVFETAAKIRRAGELVVDVVEPEALFDPEGHPVEPPAETTAPTLWAPADVAAGPAGPSSNRDQKRLDRRREKLDAGLRVKLERVMGCFDDLSPRAHREGAFTLLEAYLTRTHLLYDLIATGSQEAHRSVLVIARFMRFVADWQREHARASLGDFVQYLDLYQEVGGDLDMDGSVQARVDGVQLMTVYQAKGLEFGTVVVPRLTQKEFPDERRERQLIPVELLRQAPPAEYDVAEERRLLYVAMTRARDRLLLTTIENASENPRPGRFIGEVTGLQGEPAPLDVRVERRAAIDVAASTDADVVTVDPSAPTVALMPIPSEFERRFALRRRAVELIGALEALPPDDAGGRDTLIRDLVTVAEIAAGEGSRERLEGREPVTLRVLGAHAPAGAGLLDLVPLPPTFSHSQFRTYGDCALRYAFERVFQIPVDDAKSYFAFGHVMHKAFEAYTVARRTARALGRPDPGYAVLDAAYRAALAGEAFPDRQSQQHYESKADLQLQRFFEREQASRSEAILFETGFLLMLDPADGSAPVRLTGVLDRVDRHPDGSIEVIDYKTGTPQPQAKVDVDEQLSTYALAIREGAVRDPVTGARLPAPSRLTLYFTESDAPISTTRSSAQLDAHRDALLATVRRMRSGDFAASPEQWKCNRCDYRRICPSRWGGPAN
jgi:superfamily I DNA/RNA helicase/RecB family exonuclease